MTQTLLAFDKGPMSVNQMEHDIVQSKQNMDANLLDQFVKAQSMNLGQSYKTRIMIYHDVYMLLNPKQKEQFIAMLNKTLK